MASSAQVLMKLEDEVQRIAREHLKKEEPLLFETAEIEANLVDKPHEVDTKYADEFATRIRTIRQDYQPFKPYYEILCLFKTPAGKRVGIFGILAETGEILKAPKYS